MRNVVRLRSELERPTLGDLIRRYLNEAPKLKDMGDGQQYALELIATMPIAQRYADALEDRDFIDHAKLRRQGFDGREGVCPATVGQDMTFLANVLGYAKPNWGMREVTVQPLKDAKPTLEKYNLAGKAQVRDRRPSEVEFDLLMDYYRGQNDHHRTKVRMDVVLEFAVWSLKRISETCRLKRVDLNTKDRLVTLRDMKDPKKKKGNDFTFPLLGRAWELVIAQPVLDPNNPDECIFPYNPHSCSQRHTDACRVLGIKNLHLHDMRREGICRMFEAGYGPQEVAAVSGHKNWNTLARVYANKFNPVDLHQGPAAFRALQAKALNASA